MTDFNFDDSKLNDKFNKFREELNKLFADENWSQLYETYVMFGKEKADLLFTEQITQIFPELTGKIEGADLSDKETCNPKICKWCKYSSNGRRDPARSISMCDGCRYNEEFEHL